jgi:AhpD family alkylhydroperoxidase
MMNPALSVPGAMDALQALNAAVDCGGVPRRTLELVHLRASEINGCGVCSAGACTIAKRGGETDERLFAVHAWRHAPYFSPAERAALALTECVTRLSDRENPVPDDVWCAASEHYNPEQLASLVLAIGVINVWNRLNVATGQVVGDWVP